MTLRRSILLLLCVGCARPPRPSPFLSWQWSHHLHLGLESGVDPARVVGISMVVNTPLPGPVPSEPTTVALELPYGVRVTCTTHATWGEIQATVDGADLAPLDLPIDLAVRCPLNGEDIVFVVSLERR